MVTRADLGTTIDLNELGKYVPNYIYEPDQFPALFYRVHNPRITFIVFASGKVMGYGGQVLSDVRYEFTRLAESLAPLGIRIETATLPKICMLVGTSFIGQPIDIESLAKNLSNVVYEPDQFPGLIWTLERGIVVLAFSNGKLVITGVKSAERLMTIYNEVIRLIMEHHTFQRHQITSKELIA